MQRSGVDIIAIDPSGVTEPAEVKGYPTQYHTKGPHQGKPKDTPPKLQAGHWFSEALACIYNYGKYTAIEKKTLALAFPLNHRYLELIDKAATFFTDHDLNIKIYLIAENGTVQVSNLNTMFAEKSP